MWNKLSLRVRFTLFYSIISTVSTGILSCFLYLNIRKYQANVNTKRMILDSPVNPNSVSDELIISYKELIITLFLLVIVIIFLSIIFSWFLSKRALKPIRSLSEEIDCIEITKLPQSIPIPKTQDEVTKLTLSFNKLLSKINDTFLEQKRFAQNAAHELKTPIASILTNIEVLEMDEYPSVEDYKEVIKVTKENIERLATMVHDMLFLNRDNKESSTSFLFSELNIIDEFKAEIEKQKINVSIIGDTTIYGNQFLLKRAFANIIHNAIRYNKQNGSITITCHDQVVTITDTGIGIPYDKLDKIFEPFFCVDESRSRSLGGSGLGLSIVKQILALHNFRITVESTLGVGTKFYIYCYT